MAEDYLTRRRRELAEEERMRRAQAARARAFNPQRPLSEVARSQKLAEKYGVSLDAVAVDPKPFETMDKIDKSETLLDQHPWMTPLLLQGGVASAIPDEDLAKIGGLVSTLNLGRSLVAPASTLPGGTPHKPAPAPKPRSWTAKDYLTRVPLTLFGAAGKAFGHTAGGIVGAAEWAADTVGLGEETNDYFREVNKGYESLIESMNLGKLENTSIAGVVPATAVETGVSSLVQMLIPLPFGKKKVLGTLAGTTAGLAYTKYQDRGAGYFESTGGAVAEGAIEYATEKLSFGYLDNLLKGKSGNFVKDYLLRDIVGEQLATLGQDAVDTAIANPTKTWGDYWEERPDAAFHTLVATMTTGALVRGGELTMRQLGKITDDTRDSVDALIGQQVLDDFMDKAAKVETRTAAPEEFARFVDQGAQGIPIKNVYIPIEAVDAVLADETVPDEEKEALTLYQDQINEARLNNSELVIPVGEAAARFAGTTMWQNLREEARVLAGGISGREAREQMDELKTRLEELGNQAVEEANALAPDIAAKAGVYLEVRDQMLAAGRSEIEAKSIAALVASRAETLATGRYGNFKSAKEAWDWMQLRVIGADQQAKGKGKATKLNQTAFADVSKLLDRDDWALMTAENPDAQQLPPEENAARMAELKQTLSAMGLKFTEVRGKYGNEENSLAIEGISEDQARSLGARFGQDSVLTRRGLVYRDGTVNPARGVNLLEKDADDYFTELPDGTKFSVDINFNARLPLGQTANEAVLWSQEQIDNLISNYKNTDGTSRAMVVMLSPDEFLAAMASEKGVQLIEERVEGMPEYGVLDLAKLGTSGHPTMTVAYAPEGDRSGPMVRGHDGRHRAMMMKRAGVTQMPVVVNLITKEGAPAHIDAPLRLENILPNRSRASQVENGSLSLTLEGIPLTEAYRGELLANFGSTPVQTLQQSPLFEGDFPSSIQGALEMARSRKFPNIREFKVALQEKVRANKGNLRDPRRLMRLALNDARVALQNNANAVGWYNDKVVHALEVLGAIHPEINTDEDARFAFIYALAVTSNGLKVDRNFKLADQVYREFKSTGRMPEVGEGTAAKAMANSLRQFNELVEREGLAGLREFMLRNDISVKEVEQFTGVAVSGEHKTTKVTGAAFLGPKIGNGFFSNLYGNFDQLTMDRWFIRTWGRWTGTLIVDAPARAREKRAALKDIVRGLTPGQRRQLGKILSGAKTPYTVKLTDIDGLAQKIAVATAKKEVRDQLHELHPRLRLDGKALHAINDGQKEAPQGPKERNDIRSVMVPMLAHLREDNPDLTMADLQAVLWYPEKTLYDTARAKSGAQTAEGYADEEAPDYANAAIALARSEGISEEKIREATQRADRRVAAYRRAGGAERRAGDAGPEVTFAETREGFPAEDVLSSEKDGTLDPVSYNQFGGTKGATGEEMSRLGTAQDLESQGVDAESIWTHTGWMRGNDGLWRFEIDDSEVSIKEWPSSNTISEIDATPGIDYLYSDPILHMEGAQLLVGARLNTVIDHPELFKRYPDIGNIGVFRMEDLPQGALGYFDGTNIVVNASMPDEKALSTILHETQHAIQTLEGFANGGDPYALEEDGLGPELDSTIAYFKAVRDGLVPDAFMPPATDEQIEASARWQVYSRILGEVEARNTQKRWKMSAGRRRLTPPDATADVPPERRIIVSPTAKSYSAEQPGARGEVTFYPDGKTVVQLFAKADFSTMLHELSHVFLQQEFLLAKEKGASEELKADVERLTKWFADNGVPVNDKGMPTVGAHELFARTGERYFREGKAPSAELRGAFKQFRKWLMGVYQQVKDLLVFGPAPINPEIREIMDRMIATEEAIEANATAPMSQEDLGMTDAEYSAYVESVSGARDEAHDILLERMMKAIRRRETKRIREQRANVRAEVAAEINSDPRFVALHLLRTGRWLGEPEREAVRIKLNTGWLIDNYGEEILELLPVGLQPLHRGDGVVGDMVAEMVGMTSGDELVQSLLELKRQADQLKADGNPRPLRDQIIEDRVDEIMAQRHGDIALSEEQIEEEALAALNANRQGEVLAAELRQLKKIKADPGVVTPYRLLREWARRKVNEGTVDEAVSKSALSRYTRAYNKARNLFEQALVKRDDAEAIKQKQAQMINHALLAEGKIVADEIGAIVRRMERYARTKAMASIDQDYMDRIHELLEGYNFRKVSDVARREKASFEAWAETQRALGHEVYVPERFRDERTNWKDAKVAKLLELNDMVQSLAAQGKLKQKLTTARRERELAATVDDVESRILNLPERRQGDASTGEERRPLRQSWREAKTFAEYRQAIVDLMRPGRRIREVASELVKIEGLMDILDGTKDGTGPLNQHVVQGATEAANTFSALTEEVMEPIVERYKSMSRKQAARLRDFVTIPELTLNVSTHPEDAERIGKPLVIPRMKLIGLLLNTGNLSNMSKLVGGERWGDPDSAVDLARVRDILVSYASKEDLDLVQDIWNGVAKLWPHIVKVERELSGIVPEDVVPTEFETPYGTYAGGYWPVVWDSMRSDMGKRQQEEAESTLQGVGFGIATPKGHTITRTGAVAPMEWSVEHVLFGHMTKVISRIAYAPWVRDTLKIVDNPRVTGAIRLRLGNEYASAIKPWMRDQIPSSNVDIVGAKRWERWLDQFRINFSIAVLGISYTTGVAQMLGLGYSAGALGEGSVKDGGKWVSRGMWEMIKLQKDGLGGAQEFVFARSEEMRRRMHEVNQEATDVFRRLRDQDTPMRRMQAAAFWHIGFIDMNMVALPTWLGAYKKGLAEGLTDEEASAYGDKMVRLSQSSGRKKDLSAIQRGGAAQKFISMFYTPSSVFFNQQWEGAQHLKAGNWSKALAPTFWFLVMTTLADALREGDWPEDDDEDGLGGMDIAEWVGRNLMFGMFYGIPIARDVANTTERKIRGEYAEYGSTPLSVVMTATARGGKTAAKVYEGEETDGRDVKNAVSAIGMLFGLPGNQIGKSTGFVKDVYDDRVDPEGVYDWYHGLAYGKLPEDEGAEK